ncbi:hypothetical protein AX15_002401 [Amanita polypyramis BW_CC]|nr:hypothetical protein AX15_002401 [Amanita polypyramis BW_CC]
MMGRDCINETDRLLPGMQGFDIPLMTSNSHNSSSEEGVTPEADAARLTPPRPFFFAEGRNKIERGELSSRETSVDQVSDSDREQQLPLHHSSHRKTHAHRRRSWVVRDNKRIPTPPPQSTRPPPSSFTFPFQAYPGNPDPGMSIPGLRTSSKRPQTSDDDSGSTVGTCRSLFHSGSWTDLSRPHAPFMSPPNAVFKGSAAANLPTTPAATTFQRPGDTNVQVPRSSSSQTFRAPFLSPASRPSSSLWSPPSYPTHLVGTDPSSPSASSAALPYALPKSKPPLPSTRIAVPIPASEKPWLSKKEPRETLGYFITVICLLLGLGGAAVLCWRGISSVQKLDPSRLCLVLDENFDGTSLDNSVWSLDVELGGFGNGEFQMTTSSSDNLFLQNSQLYIYPTLTSDSVPNVLNGGNYTLSDCTTNNRTACAASSNAARGTVINPVMSARINTKGKKNVKYGKVEIKAKLPKGDWLWPAIWMLPEQNTYGNWPSSGEIDILEARGNSPSYPAQGSNYVRSSVNYGPLPTLLNQIYGWYSIKRSSFDQNFHVYGFEWDKDFMRFYTDSRVNGMLNIRLTGEKNSFWQRGGFPQTAQNGSAKVAVDNPWDSSGPSAPFDQPFYLIIDLAVGGTSGWFPDNKGGKPWYDGSLTAMRAFALAQDKWYPTWPGNKNDRAFRM